MCHLQSGTFSFDLFDATDDDVDVDMEESSTDDDMATATVPRAAFMPSGGTHTGICARVWRSTSCDGLERVVPLGRVVLPRPHPF
jgi:hypothetical protein